MFNFSLDLRLDMLIRVMLINETWKSLSVFILLISDINSEANEEH